MVEFKLYFTRPTYPQQQTVNNSMSNLQTWSPQVSGFILFLSISSVSFAAPTETNSVHNSESENLLSSRLSKFQSSEDNNLVLFSYRENYLVYSYLLNGVNQQPLDDAFPNETHHFKDYEVQFQFSFLVPLASDIFDLPLGLFGAYTNRSFWQLFDEEDSRPFRETNHEPEIWLSYHYDLNWGELKAPMIWFGFRHQSNGQYVPWLEQDIHAGIF